MSYRLRQVGVAFALLVIAACDGGEIVSPEATIQGVPTVVAEGNVKWFCWLNADGNPHHCYISCEDEIDVLTVDPSGVFSCETPPPPEEEPDPPPGGGGGGPPPQVDSTAITLVCSQNVVRGQSGTCTLQAAGWVPITNIEWYTVIPDHSPSKTGGMSWSGPIIDDTRVHVTFNAAGTSKHYTQMVTVARRGWLDFPTSTQYSPGTAPDCETGAAYSSLLTGSSSAIGWIIGLNCLDRTEMLSPDPNLSSSYQVATVTTGPNQGMWYVATRPMTMHLRSQILPDLRGVTQHTVGYFSPSDVKNYCPNPASYVTVNNCAVTTGNNWATMINNIWDHEEAHYDAAVQGASHPAGNLWFKMEETFAYQQSDLFNALANAANNISGYLFSEAATVDNYGSHGPYNFYAHQGGGTWVWMNVTLNGAL